MSTNGNSDLIFLKKRHVKYFHRCLQLLPFSTASFDTSRVTVLFFALSGLDILDSLDVISEEERERIIDWIYSMQVVNMVEVFVVASSLSSIPLKEDMKSKDTIIELDCGHIAMTYTGISLSSHIRRRPIKS
ncbi:Geranylgeranyl transferase type-1 subunit beta [Armadillidium vulgare]|nr:Geranylgeranyl transferase type-1 subunit beta [Armadillidium vulgare]